MYINYNIDENKPLPYSIAIWFDLREWLFQGPDVKVVRKARNAWGAAMEARLRSKILVWLSWGAGEMQSRECTNT